MKRIVSTILVSALLVSGLSACTGKPAEGDATTTPSSGSSTTAPLSATKDVNPLTGLYELEKGAANRPVGIMIANDSTTTGKQAGIDKADFYMECETEGAIPRLLAVFAGASRVPDKLGPVRSARSPFIATARALDAVYCHAGGSAPAKATLSSGKVDHIDAFTDSVTFWRDSVLKSKMDYVHSVATSGEKLETKLKKMGFPTTLNKKLPFTFGEAVGDQAATQVQLKTTPSRFSSFVYNSETGLYTKQLGKLDDAKAHKSLEGNAITVSNVLVLYAEKYVEDTYNHTTVYNFRNGSGTGYLISGGTSRAIQFTRTNDSLSIRESDGRAAVFATGKTYLCLVDKNLASTFAAS